MLCLHFQSVSTHSYLCFQVTHPSDIFKTGDTVDVVCIGKDELTGRPRISAKSLSSKTRETKNLEEFVETYLK